MKANPKSKPSTEERAKIATMAAAGMSQQKISKTIGRSRHLVKNILAEPQIQRAVKDEKAKLSQLYREKARDVVLSISNEDIDKANLLQKATSSAILLDKSLLLAGESTVNVSVLLEVAHAIRSRDQGRVVLPSQRPALSQPEPEDSLTSNPTSMYGE